MMEIEAKGWELPRKVDVYSLPYMPLFLMNIHLFGYSSVFKCGSGFKVFI